MAKIVLDGAGEREVPDGASLHEPCEELGVPFGCSIGQCQSCRVDVLEGAENLSDLTQEEKDAFMDAKTRLACQCKIKHGKVVLRY